MNRFAHLAAQSPLLGVEPFRAALEFAWPHLAAPALPTTGDGHPVVIFPGLGADGSSVTVLRDHCRALGYTAFDWGQGFNIGPQGHLDTWLHGLAQRVSSLLVGHAKPATLIGWSLGGLYARELGKLLVPRLRQVITIGTPLSGSAEHTHAGWLYRLVGASQPDLEAALTRRLRASLPVPTTSIYSRSDGVIAWQACVERRDVPCAENVEVEGSHVGLGWNPDVLRVVADRLAQPEGHWQPLRAPH
jgi:hypothetical protein